MGIKKFIASSMIEWDGRISAILVFGGCNLRCGFCHGTEFIEDHGRNMRLSTIMKKLEEKKDWLDGVVLSGGEATLDKNIIEVAKEIKNAGFDIKLHTNGTKPDVVEQMINDGFLRCLALDYKSLLDDSFIEATGNVVSYETLGRVKKSFDLAATNVHNMEIEYHTTIVPSIMNLSYFQEMSESLEPHGKWFLQQFNNENCLDKGMKKVKPYELKNLEDYKIIACLRHDKVLTSWEQK